ncbi:MAG: hypothetical protein JSV88_03250 [Candidatus Aminicenantes bacterium]|nr:MAG: hypothetical protein JSV88_03250 [Candidatus Aminicenantes bacterium]
MKRLISIAVLFGLLAAGTGMLVTSHLRAQDVKKCWCRIHGKVVYINARECLRKGGQCFRTRKAALESSRPLTQKTGWCCVDGKVVHIPPEECKQKGGRFFKFRQKALEFCRSKPDVSRPGLFFAWSMATPKYPRPGQKVTITGSLAGGDERTEISATLIKKRKIHKENEPKYKRNLKSRDIPPKRLPVTISKHGIFKTGFIPGSIGTYVVSFRTQKAGNYRVKDMEITVSNSGIPGYNFDPGSTPDIPDTPTVDPLEPDSFCVEPPFNSPYPDDELLSVQFKDMLTEVVKIFLNKYLEKGRNGELAINPDVFSNSLHQFNSASELGDFFGFEIPDELFSFNFDLPSLICLTGEVEDCGDEQVTDAGLKIHIPAAEFQINWEDFIDSTQVEVMDNDPNFKIKFSMNAALTARATFRVEGTGNQADPLYQLLFPNPAKQYFDIPFEITSIAAQVEGTASITPNGQFQDITVSVVPTGTEPWELDEIEQVFSNALTVIETWIVGVMAQLATAQPPPPYTAANNIYALLSAIPVVGPVICAALPVAMPVVGTILWQGTCPLNPNNTDCRQMIDFENTTLDFNTITYYGFRHIALSYATSLFQDQVNSLFENLDLTEFLTMIPISESGANYSLLLGPKRMNAKYPSNDYHTLGGMAEIEVNIPGGNPSCLVGNPPTTAPNFPSDYLSNPEAFYPPWTYSIPGWHVSVNIHQNLFQDLLNRIAETGQFCRSVNGSLLGYQYALRVEEAAYPQITLNTTPYAVPITDNTTITIGTIQFERTGGPGLKLELVVNKSTTITVELDLRTDFNVTFKNEKMGFSFTDFEAANVTINGVTFAGAPRLYSAVTGMINQFLASLTFDNQALGFDGVTLPFKGYCLKLTGYGAWEYCEVPDRAMGIMIEFDENECPN